MNEPKKRGRKPRHPEFRRTCEVKVRYSARELLRINATTQYLGSVRADFIRDSALYFSNTQRREALRRFMAKRRNAGAGA